MNTPPSFSDDSLEALLKRTNAPIPDDGFTTRVLASLPPPAEKPHRTPNRRLVVCLAGGLVGVVCAVLTSGLPNPGDIETASTAWLTWTTQLAENKDDLVPLATSSGIIALALATAFSRNIVARVKALDLL